MKAFTALLAFLTMCAVYADKPLMIALNEADCTEQNLVPYKRLVSEYLAAELDAKEGINVKNPDDVAAAMSALKIPDGKESGPASIKAICKKLDASFFCLGTISKSGGKVQASIDVMKADSSKTGNAKFEMSGIEDCDDAAASIATQISKIVKGKPAPKE